MTAILGYIEDENLFDPNNPRIVLCSEALEMALDRKAFSLDQMEQVIVHHLLRENLIFDVPKLPITIIYRKNVIFKTYNGPSSLQFLLQPKFLSLLKTTEKCQIPKYLFTYSEILKLFTKYILSQRDLIIDDRNLYIAIIQNHPLELVFNVKAFHKKQSRELIDKQLIFSNLVDLCSYKVSIMVMKSNVSQLEIPFSVKNLIRRFQKTMPLN